MSPAETVATRASCSACGGAACDRCFQSGLEPFPTGFHPDAFLTAAKLFPNQTLAAFFGAPAPEVFPPVIVNSDSIPLAGGIRNQTTTDSCVGFTFAEVLSHLRGPWAHQDLQRLLLLLARSCGGTEARGASQ